jgi:hypothetical protein
MHKAPSSSRNDVVVQDEELEADNEDQVNDSMEVDDNNNIVQVDETNQMIQDLFGHPDEDHGKIGMHYIYTLQIIWTG